MLNKKVNLSLKFNKSLNNLNGDSGPFTPLEQTSKNEQAWANTPVVPPPKQEIYSNPNYNESDDFLVVASNEDNGYKTTKNFTLNFTSNFDLLVMSVYSHILSLPTTTPFLGSLPPSGLVSKVANETMNSIFNATMNNQNPPMYDQQAIITAEALLNHYYQPIFLQLMRKRFLDLCTYNVDITKSQSQQLPVSTPRKLPESTSVSITSAQNGAVSINSYSGNNIRHSSISNLSLTELNISNYNANNDGTTELTRSRNSSLSLRKQSLTRNNSHSSTSNWLHVGNINSIRPNQAQFTGSTDSLQSLQDYVPQSLINRSHLDYQTPPSKSNLVHPQQTSNIAPPPNVFGNSFGGGHTLTPPHSGDINMGSDYDDFTFYQERSRSGSVKSGSFPRPLTINTDSANSQTLNALNGDRLTFNGFALDSPFMSATTPQDDYGYFCNGFASLSGGSISASSSIGASPVLSHHGNNDALPDNKIMLPAAVSLSEKKRDSLKLKRGIH